MVGMALRLVVLAVFIIDASFNTASAQPRRQVTEQEFLNLYNQDMPIQNCVIPAYFIRNVVEEAEQINKTNQTGVPYYTLKIYNSSITGMLQLHEGDTPREVFMGIDFSNTIFSGEVVLYHSNFREPAYFNRCVFAGPVNATDTSFTNGVSFSGSAFKSPVLFTGCKVSGGKAYFLETTFYHWAFFDDATFSDGADFTGAKFLDEVNLSANFDDVTIFTDVIFSNVAVFREHRMNGWIQFQKTKFLDDVIFEKINGPGANLNFAEARFQGRIYCTDSELQSLLFSPDEGRPPIVFEKMADFHGIKCEEGDFRAVDFRDYVNFSQAQFLKKAELSDTTFESEVNLYGTQFGEWKDASNNEEFQLQMDGVRFEKTANLQWRQLVQKQPWWFFWREPKLKILTTVTDTWKSLEEMFSRSGNLKGENEAMYQRRILARTLDPANEDSESSGWECFENYFSEIFWGYGVRPARLVLWMLFFYLSFTSLYLTQTNELSKGKNCRDVLLKRLGFAIKFSGYTSVKPFYGFQQSNGKTYKTITVMHYFAFTIMLVCFLDSIARVSPLLHEIVGKLLPI